MTPLSLDAPLANLRALSGLSHRTLGERCDPRVSDVAVVHAEARGNRIKLATLAAYAHAAGYTLWLRATMAAPCRACRVGETVGDVPLWMHDLDVTVAGARALLAALGLTIVLAVEPAEGSERCC